MPRDESSQFRDATRTLQPGVDETTMRRRPPALTPGETFGRFRLIQLLGRGGMGEAYEAEDLKSGERVALKMSRDVLATEQQREQFLREGRVVAAISHPHLVYVVGTEEIQEIPVLVTELVTGSTLRARVTEGGPLPSIEAVDMILQVISGWRRSQPMASCIETSSRPTASSARTVGSRSGTSVLRFPRGPTQRVREPGTWWAHGHSPRPSSFGPRRRTSGRTFTQWVRRFTTC